MPIKNYIIILGILIGGLSTAYAQEEKLKENFYILICGTDQAEFSLQDIKKCNSISVRDSEAQVSSFTFSVFSKKEKILVEIKIQGNELNDECFEWIENKKMTGYIYIEHVKNDSGDAIKGFRKILITNRE